MASWSFLTSHARVLLCVARDPGVRRRDIAAGLDITERSACGIVTDLTAAGENWRGSGHTRVRAMPTAWACDPRDDP